MTTLWPPPLGPMVGDTEVMPGAVVKVYRSAAVATLVPAAVLTRTWTAPAAWAGVTAVILVGELTVNDAAAVEPKLTQLTPLKSAPLMVTVWPPPVGPVAGETELIVDGTMTTLS